ncbi:energy-coupling factor transport system ATP-binding protein [Alicyclobacillus sacchari]|uniref:Energy-coupling factor transport system ATP-binding protein n=1 Tax=Alicyclobacillus sacchari TaxID=392010 RepID=A0A4R8LKV8_9BACL|nr:ABC transporter ATP-binding protein [Alicyclobacillus sacchari]TDY43043.1 energy-coupling factor transport system ATP-binding protein [Alicyclobacillus sacchari]GMA57766.1 energy-coupling factor transporter ATP-binding protein EcfA1 [Alicyclobacillus sacchari]
MHPVCMAWNQVFVRRVGIEEPVLQDVSFTVEEPQVIAIVGHNGAGKTTFARVMVGLVPIASGQITILGEPFTAERRQVQMGFQPLSAQILGGTVEEELAIALASRDFQGLAMDWISMRNEIQSLCRQFGLAVRLSTPVHHLSGGQLARLCIASAIASGADFLVMDETQAELDPVTRDTMRRLFRRLAAKGKTIFLVTHDMEDVLTADRVLVLDAGKLVADMPVTSFFYAENHGTTPCEQYRFDPPVLVHAARSSNRRLGLNLTPLTETEWTEGLLHAVASRWNFG